MNQATNSTPTFDLNGIAGLVHERTARQTGTVVQLFNAAQAGVEADGGWVLFCEHGTHQDHTKYKMALAGMPKPHDFCEKCAQAAAERASKAPTAKAKADTPVAPKVAEKPAEPAETVAYVTPATDGGWDVTINGKHVGTYSSKSNANRKARKLADRIADTNH